MGSSLHLRVCRCNEIPYILRILFYHVRKPRNVTQYLSTSLCHSTCSVNLRLSTFPCLTTSVSFNMTVSFSLSASISQCLSTSHGHPTLECLPTSQYHSSSPYYSTLQCQPRSIIHCSFSTSVSQPHCVNFTLSFNLMVFHPSSVCRPQYMNFTMSPNFSVMQN